MFPVQPSFVGLSGAGLYQINVVVPAGPGRWGRLIQASVGGMVTQTGSLFSLGGALVIYRPVVYARRWMATAATAMLATEATVAMAATAVTAATAEMEATAATVTVMEATVETAVTVATAPRGGERK